MAKGNGRRKDFEGLIEELTTATKEQNKLLSKEERAEETRHKDDRAFSIKSQLDKNWGLVQTFYGRAEVKKSEEIIRQTTDIAELEREDRKQENIEHNELLKHQITSQSEGIEDVIKADESKWKNFKGWFERNLPSKSSEKEKENEDAREKGKMSKLFDSMGKGLKGLAAGLKNIGKGGISWLKRILTAGALIAALGLFIAFIDSPLWKAMIKAIQDDILPAMKRLWETLKPIGIAMAKWFTTAEEGEKTPLQKTTEAIGKALEYITYVFGEIGKSLGVGNEKDPGTGAEAKEGQSWITTLWNIKYFIAGLALLLFPKLAFAGIAAGTKALTIAIGAAPLALVAWAGLALWAVVDDFIKGWKGAGDVGGPHGRTNAEKLSEGIGKALGGDAKGGWWSATKKAVQWAGIGAGVGALFGFGLPGAIVGGLIGMAVGGLFGYFGSDKTTKFAAAIIDPIDKAFGDVKSWFGFGPVFTDDQKKEKEKENKEIQNSLIKIRAQRVDNQAQIDDIVDFYNTSGYLTEERTKTLKRLNDEQAELDRLEEEYLAQQRRNSRQLRRQGVNAAQKVKQESDTELKTLRTSLAAYQLAKINAELTFGLLVGATEGETIAHENHMDVLNDNIEKTKSLITIEESRNKTLTTNLEKARKEIIAKGEGNWWDKFTTAMSDLDAALENYGSFIGIPLSYKDIKELWAAMPTWVQHPVELIKNIWKASVLPHSWQFWDWKTWMPEKGMALDSDEMRKLALRAEEFKGEFWKMPEEKIVSEPISVNWGEMVTDTKSWLSKTFADPLIKYFQDRNAEFKKFGEDMSSSENLFADFPKWDIGRMIAQAVARSILAVAAGPAGWFVPELVTDWASKTLGFGGAKELVPADLEGLGQEFNEKTWATNARKKAEDERRLELEALTDKKNQDFLDFGEDVNRQIRLDKSVGKTARDAILPSELEAASKWANNIVMQRNSYGPLATKKIAELAKKQQDLIMKFANFRAHSAISEELAQPFLKSLEKSKIKEEILKINGPMMQRRFDQGASTGPTIINNYNNTYASSNSNATNVKVEAFTGVTDQYTGGTGGASASW